MIAAKYYLECLERLEIVSRQVKWDCHTRNVIEFVIQCDKRRNHGYPESDTYTFVYGSSPSNKWVESWWTFFDRLYSGWLINFFKDFMHNDHYYSENNLKNSWGFFFLRPYRKILTISSFYWIINTYKSHSSVVNGLPNKMHCYYVDQSFFIQRK